MTEIVLVVSSYGMGHVTRQIALKNALHSINPDLVITMVLSEEQQHIFKDAILSHDNDKIETIPLTPRLTMESPHVVDIESTREIYTRFWEWETQIRDDTEWGRILRKADIIVNDIVSVHNPIASKMRIPIINISNFPWSDILVGMGLEDLAGKFATWERMSSHNLVLPLSTSWIHHDQTIPVGLLRRKIDPIKVESLQAVRNKKMVFFNFPHPTPEINIAEILKDVIRQGYVPIIQNIHQSGLTTIEEDCLFIESMETDIHNYVAAADIVVSKIGYGIVSECLGGGTPLLYWKRKYYIEDDVLGEYITKELRGSELTIPILNLEIMDGIRKWIDTPLKALPDCNGEIAQIVINNIKAQ